MYIHTLYCNAYKSSHPPAGRRLANSIIMLPPDNPSLDGRTRETATIIHMSVPVPLQSCSTSPNQEKNMRPFYTPRPEVEVVVKVESGRLEDRMIRCR
jgi:hypothetical protein